MGQHLLLVDHRRRILQNCLDHLPRQLWVLLKQPGEGVSTGHHTELARTDALVFGEHLGEPPGFGGYTDAGMRLLDNPLRNHLNSVLGNPSATLAGLEQRDGGGFSAGVRVMHAQSHDSDYAVRRELQNAFYFFREGVPLVYSDGYNKSDSCGDCGGPFPRHANAAYLGEYGDGKLPDLAWLHHELARGGSRGRWGDSDVVAFERYDYREGGSAADQTVLLFAMNDNYGYPVLTVLRRFEVQRQCLIRPLPEN
jgi:hypothetical protein